MYKSYKKQKGQILILDMLFALVLIIFLFFIVSKVVEIRTYENISDSRFEELEKVGSLVYDRLTNNPNINCYIFDADNHYLLRSCIANNSEIKKKHLGLPANYGCFVSFDEEIGIDNECNDDDSDVEEYFLVKQEMFTVNEREISKNEHKQKIIGEAEYETTTMTLKVWRK